jgi:uncharacterized tellurite resistance protein B-like protein
MSEQEVTYNGKRRIYRVLCHLAWCDGELHPSERDYLAAYAKANALRPDETASLEKEGRSGQGLGVSKRPAEREALIDHLIRIAMADGQLVAEEQERLVKFGGTIGLNEQEIAARVVHVASGSGRTLSPDAPSEGA